MDWLADAREKLSWAHHHRELIDTDDLRLFRNKFYSPTVEFDAEGNQYFLRAEYTMPSEVTHTIGDYVHNLRAALDFTAYAAAASRETADDKVMFVIAESESEFANKAWRLKGLSGDQIDAMQKFQPYNGQLPSGTRIGLLTLERLSNVGKHRHIPVLVAYAGVVQFAIDDSVAEDISFDFRALNQRQVFARIPADVYDQMREKPEVQFSIAFGQQGDWNAHWWHLRQLYNVVRDEVIPAFARLLSNQE